MAHTGCHLWLCGSNRCTGDSTIDHTTHLPIGGCPVLPNAMPRIRQYNRCGMRHRWSTRHSHWHEGQSTNPDNFGNTPQQRQPHTAEGRVREEWVNTFKKQLYPT